MMQQIGKKLNLFLGAFLLLASSQPLASSLEMPSRLFSRSIMDHCSYVYRVESDIRVAFDSTQFQEFRGIYGDDLLLKIQFFNSWEGEPRSFEMTLDSALAQDGFTMSPVLSSYSVFEFTLETMSTASHYLYRDLHFSLGFLEEGSFKEITSWNHGDAGRRFGEACQTSRGPQVPWIERELLRP